jgi:hypothetical protein
MHARNKFTVEIKNLPATLELGTRNYRVNV